MLLNESEHSILFVPIIFSFKSSFKYKIKNYFLLLFYYTLYLNFYQIILIDKNNPIGQLSELIYHIKNFDNDQLQEFVQRINFLNHTPKRESLVLAISLSIISYLILFHIPIGGLFSIPLLHKILTPSEYIDKEEIIAKVCLMSAEDIKFVYDLAREIRYRI